MTDKPNIVFILTDNVGYGVPSSYNGGILGTPTPPIDKLAAEGLRLTRCAVNPGPDWAHFGHTWAQTEATSANYNRCDLAAHCRFEVLT
jgi:hypothetical protein